MRGLIFFAVVLAIYGCATQPIATQMRETPEGPQWDEIKASGLREDFLSGFSSPKNPEPGSVLTLRFNSFKVTWWGEFKAFTFITSTVLVAKWIDPKGNVFWEEEFSHEVGKGFARYEASLPIYDSPARNYPGLWQVIIYYNGTAIDQKKFYIREYNARDIVLAPGPNP